jgi:hypothetical protein
VKWISQSNGKTDKVDAGVLAEFAERTKLFMETLDLDEFISQSDEYREGGDLLDSVYKVLNAIGATHPFAVVRVAELRDWMESGAYDRILAGDYPRRDEEDTRPYREDLAEAMNAFMQRRKPEFHGR